MCIRDRSCTTHRPARSGAAADERRGCAAGKHAPPCPPCRPRWWEWHLQMYTAMAATPCITPTCITLSTLPLYGTLLPTKKAPCCHRRKHIHARVLKGNHAPKDSTTKPLGSPDDLLHADPATSGRTQTATVDQLLWHEYLHHWPGTHCQ